VVSYGEAEARPYANLWERLVRKSLTFTRFHLGHLDYSSAVWSNGAKAVMDAISAGALSVPIEGVYPLEGVHEMYARLESRQVSGKLLLKIGG
jgi:NADPH2:quinone reductase